MRNCLLAIFALLLLSFHVNSQPDKTYYSIEDALVNPDLVYKLSLQEINEPAELVEFKNIKELSLSGLTDFPKEILQLRSLEELNLYLHEISVIPEGIEQLSNLKVLYARRNTVYYSEGKVTYAENQSTSLPESIVRLVNLEELNLPQNGLTTLPDLSKLTKLRKLNLSYNNLEQLPDVFDNLYSLEELLLAKNGMSVLPPSIGKLQRLTTLDLKYNQFTSIPAVVFACTNLEKLELTGNKLTSISQEIGSLTQLRVLDLSFNKELTDLPSSFSMLKKLEELDLTLNAFDEILPGEVYGLTSLKELTFQKQKFGYEEDFQKQPLGDGFCALTNLEELIIKANELTSLPSCFGNLKQLKRLTLSFSPTSPEFPKEITQLTNLERLEFTSRGYVISVLPPDMYNLTKLKSLKLVKLRLSEAQKSQLQQDLPNCRIKYGR